MSERPSAAARHEVTRRTSRRLLQGIGLVVALWLFFFALWSELPWIRPGFMQIYAEKLRMVETDPLFLEEAPVKLIVFGDSRVLSGFKPELFRNRSGGRVSAFNFGLPAAHHFIDELETLVDRGEVPTHVFLTVPWETEAEPSGFEHFRDDSWLIEQIFPFRRLIRDLTLFFIRSWSRGGPIAYYHKGKENIEQMRADGGYFFIEGQAHHEGNRLPDDFRLDSDDPTTSRSREILLRGPILERLIALRERARFRVAFIPSFKRARQSAPAPSNSETAKALEPIGIDLIGPDYWLFPNRLFSDPTHLNPEGADCYSSRLWTITGSYLLGSQDDRSPVPKESLPPTDDHCDGTEPG